MNDDMTAMDVRGLGYVGVRAKDVDEWASFGTRLLGMQIVDRSRASVALRMDDRRQRVIVSGDGAAQSADQLLALVEVHFLGVENLRKGPLLELSHIDVFGLDSDPDPHLHLALTGR